MRPSIVLTVAVPAVGNKSNSRIYQAADTPMRVVVRNNGGSLVYIAHDANDVSQANSVGGAFQLPAGDSEVFVLAPKQSLFAAGNGGGGLISVAASEALPLGQAFLES